MLVNSSLTVYHEKYDEEKRINTWIRFNYGSEDENKVWFHGGKGASTNKGYDNANDINIRIPYDINTDLNIDNFKIGDILVPTYIDLDIITPKDLNNYEKYSITSIINNTYGINKHIHIGGK